MRRPSRNDLERSFAAAISEDEPDDLGPAQAKALKQASRDDYYAALAALRAEDWKAFLARVPPSKRRAALRTLEDVVLDAEMPVLRRLVPAARTRR